MSRIVFFNIPAYGHINPTLEVVRCLVRQGHEVLYYAYEPFRQAIVSAGARFIPCDDLDGQLRLTPRQSARLGTDLALSTKVLVDTTLALDGPVCREMERVRPSCVVADSMAVWGRAVAGKLGLPFVCSTTTFAFNRHSARILKQRPGRMLSLLWSMGAVEGQVRRLRDHGYPVKNILDIIASDEQTHTIVYTSPQFQPCSDTFSEKFAFVGPSIRPAESQVERTGRPLVYVSMGTVNNDLLPLYRRCVRALGELGCAAILSVGERVDLSALGPLPPGVAAYPRVDQIAVLEQADVFVSHCGMNSVSESLYHGVPLVMLPKTDEQRGVAARTAQLGAGLLVKSTASRALRQALEQVLSTPSYHAAAAAIGQGFRACPGPAGAAEKILSCCRDQPTREARP